MKVNQVIWITTITLLLAFNTISAERSAEDIERDKTSKPQQILEFAGIKKGDRVLDFLGGSGYYAELIADKLGEPTKVTLHNNNAYIPFVGKALTDRRERGGLKGIQELISEADDLQLGSERFDVAILVLGYHDFFYKSKNWYFPVDVVMPQLRQSLKKGGRLLVIDHNAQAGKGLQEVETLHRIESEYAKKDLIKRGFRLVKSADILLNPRDPKNISAFDKSIRRKTDRFVFLFEKD